MNFCSSDRLAAPSCRHREFPLILSQPRPSPRRRELCDNSKVLRFERQTRRAAVRVGNKTLRSINGTPTSTSGKRTGWQEPETCEGGRLLSTGGERLCINPCLTHTGDPLPSALCAAVGTAAGFDMRRYGECDGHVVHVRASTDAPVVATCRYEDR